MIKALLGFMVISAMIYGGYSYVKTLDADELERFVTVGGRVLAVLSACLIIVACIIMIF